MNKRFYYLKNKKKYLIFHKELNFAICLVRKKFLEYLKSFTRQFHQIKYLIV